MKKYLFLCLIISSLSFSKTESLEYHKETQGVVGAGIGSIVGGIVGDIGGGSVGATIGSIAGPGGAIGGAVIGKKFGGIIGSGVGGVIGNYLIPFSDKKLKIGIKNELLKKNIEKLKQNNVDKELLKEIK